MQYLLIDPVRLLTVPLGLLLQNGNPSAEIALVDSVDDLCESVSVETEKYAVVNVENSQSGEPNFVATLTRLRELGVRRAVFHEREATANRLRLAFSHGASGYFATSCLTPDILVEALSASVFQWALGNQSHKPVILPAGKSMNKRLCQTYKAGALERSTLSYLTGYSGKELRTALYRAG